MRNYLFVIAAFALCLAGCEADVGEASASGAIVDEGPKEHLIYRPDDIEWQPGPASFEPGSEFAVLEGDLAQPGVFTMRIRMPDGFHISPHWHENVERVTVLSGRFHLGMGEQLDRQAARPLEPGSYTSIPREMRHYAIAEGQTEIQLTSVGPWIIKYVNPQDDPRLRK
jgi:quercetin dioxygenase-like cupin family protein